MNGVVQALVAGDQGLGGGLGQSQVSRFVSRAVKLACQRELGALGLCDDFDLQPVHGLQVQGQIGVQGRVAAQPRWAGRTALGDAPRQIHQPHSRGGDLPRFPIPLKGGYFPLTP